MIYLQQYVPSINNEFSFLNLEFFFQRIRDVGWIEYNNNNNNNNNNNKK